MGRTQACCDWQCGESSLKLHGGGYLLGICPLRAKDFLKRQNLRGAPVEMTDAKSIGETNDPCAWPCCDWQCGENSLKLHGGGYLLGISPLRAKDFLKRQNLRGAPVEMTDAKGLRETTHPCCCSCCD